MRIFKVVICLLLLCALVLSCTSRRKQSSIRFERVESENSGILFENQLSYSEAFNVYTYRNFYNGAGVAVGDINNDNLLDIYFAGNQVDNRLYLNVGNFRFKDITEQAGVACKNVWSTGVSMVDINGDGLLDIFVCKSGPPSSGIRHNELFINNGDLTFREESVAWGVADVGLSLQAAFLDYDNDGDVDMYLLNNSNRPVGIFDLRKGQRSRVDSLGGNKLYRNEGERFSDVTKEAGIFSSNIGFGLGVAIADLNRDGWADVFVSNDFFERDYLYINNRNGTFTEMLPALMEEISLGSMGADIADLNNDGLPEIFVTEMLPNSVERVRTKVSFEDWNKFTDNVRNGYHRQYPRNVLQWHMGTNASGYPMFGEIGRYAGVAATDWSWGTLIFDADNDGDKDIFVANGIAKDLTDQDYINFDVSRIVADRSLLRDSLVLTSLINSIPESPLQNFLFSNVGDFKFVNIAREAGLSDLTFSSGAAYGDFDNDGQLDLVINNVNQKPLLYRNVSNGKSENNYLQIQLNGANKNKNCLGAQVSAYINGEEFYAEQYTVRGYMSTISNIIHIGVGKAIVIDSIIVRWPNATKSKLYDVPSSQRISLNERQAHQPLPGLLNSVLRSQFNFTELKSPPILHRDSSSNMIGFDRDRLLFEAVSVGSAVSAVADLNNDGLDDVIVGGATGFFTTIYLQHSDGSFTSTKLDADSDCEDADIVVFDVDKDGFLDIIVGSGGARFSNGSFSYRDRIYLNDGDGQFQANANLLAGKNGHSSTAFIKQIDLNGDRFQDLVVGQRCDPFNYGRPVGISFFENLGGGRFQEITEQISGETKELGLLTDAAVFDFDNDGDMDVFVVGEWMRPVILRKDASRFKILNESSFERYDGLWTCLSLADINHDGYTDILVGNRGQNVLYCPSVENPWTLYYGDFDDNSHFEHLWCQKIDGDDMALSAYSSLIKQIPSLRKAFPTYKSFGNASVEHMFGKAKLNEARKMSVEELRSGVFVNQQGSSFTFSPLPWQGQTTKVTDLLAIDQPGDTTVILTSGNYSWAKPEWGGALALSAAMFISSKEGVITFCPPERSGLRLQGEVRSAVKYKTNTGNYVLFLLTNSNSRLYEFRK